MNATTQTAILEAIATASDAGQASQVYSGFDCLAYLASGETMLAKIEIVRLSYLFGGQWNQISELFKMSSNF